jgi:FkbM family methyltransferase
MNTLSGLVRGVLDRLGYVLWKRDVISYGVISFLDIARLSKAMGREVEVFFDVGANIGQTSEAALKTFPSGKVYAFEPKSSVFNRLRDAVSDVRFSAHQLALSDVSSEVVFYEYGAVDAAEVIGSLAPDARFAVRHGLAPIWQSIVTCTTLDEFCERAGIPKVDVLKIDVKGFELFVLKGAKRLLGERAIQFVYVEFNDLLPKPGTTGGALFPIAEYLGLHGFTCVATYTDYINPEGEMFVVSNALFALSSS